MPDRFHVPGFRGGTPTGKKPTVAEIKEVRPLKSHEKVLEEVQEGTKKVITHEPPLPPPVVERTFDYKVYYEDNVIAQFTNEMDAYKFVKMMNKAKGSELYSFKR